MADTPLPPAVADWMMLQETFEKLTHLIGKPRWALEALHRALLCGDVRSLRRRRILTSGVDDAELNREFWGDLELKFLAPNAPERKRAISDPGKGEVAFPKADERDVIWLSPDPDKDVALDIIAQGDTFYLHRADCAEIWPELAPPRPEVKTQSLGLAAKFTLVIREEIRRVNSEAKAAGKRVPNKDELPDLVSPA
jgi:hypothetical protein